MKIRKNVALSDSGFLFNPSTGDSYSVNEIGRQIIDLIQNGKSEDEIISNIMNDYMVDKSSFEKDLYDFKNMLETYKLIE
jgi:tRNA A37 methylthiotransferase MiaB